MINNIKRWFREKYLFLRYKLNKKHKPILIKSTDRGFGLSFLVMNSSLRTGIPILVVSERTKHWFAREMFMLGMLGLAPYHSFQYILDNLLICSSTNFVGREIHKIYVDNACSLSYVNRMCDYLSCEIENGFVRED